jgi:hypothetical protein
VNAQRTFPCFINIVSDLSGSQCLSGFTVGIHETTSDFGFTRLDRPEDRSLPLFSHVVYELGDAALVFESPPLREIRDSGVESGAGFREKRGG